MRNAILCLTLFLAACATRPMTESERAFISTVQGDAVDMSDVRIVKGAVVGLIEVTRETRPQTTCAERLSPLETEPVTGSFAALALFETLYYSRWAHSEDFLKDYPETIRLTHAMRLAHELTHVWQWQRRDITGYAPWKAASEHVGSNDPYLVEIDPDRPFLDYAFEQQGTIVEEFVCCRALDPNGARTQQLSRLVAQVFPDAARQSLVPRAAVRLPWDGAETRGICS